MSVPAVPVSVPGASDVGDGRGRRLGSWSLAMVPMLIVTAIPTAVLGMYLLGRHDLEGSEPMSVQGGYGWMVWGVSAVLLLIPSMIGVVLGFMARGHGASRRGLLGILVNGAILIGYPVVSIIGLLRQ